MRIALAVVAALLLIALGLVFLFFMVNVTGLPLCAEFAPNADECIDSTSAQRAIGLVTGWIATVCTVLGTTLGIRWATTTRSGGWFALSTFAAPILAIVTAVLIPIEF